MKTTATLESLNLTAAEQLFVEHCKDAGWTEDEIFCAICEDRKIAEDDTSDWASNRY